MGAVTALALNVQRTWQKLLQGESGIAPITHFDTSDYKTAIAGELKDFEPRDFLDVKEVRRTDRFTQMAMAAAAEAVHDADLENARYDNNRVGVIVSSGIGGMKTFENEAVKLSERGPNRVSPFFIPMMIPDIAAGKISMRYNFRGPNYSMTSACASSANALADALLMIQLGHSDIIISGGTEAGITPLGIAGFSAMKALSTSNEFPEKASRPFDAKRDGFVMGEGAGILVIESLEHALSRDAKIYAEIAGFGLSADAHHLTAPSPDGDGAKRAMQAAIKNAKLRIDQVHYINAHGTSTPANDKTETLAIHKVFGDAAQNINISSTKSMIGHLLGASGAVEAIASVLAVRNGKIPPTINQENADPDCRLNYTPNVAVTREVEAALSNSFGFGGHNVCLAFKKFIN